MTPVISLRNRAGSAVLAATLLTGVAVVSSATAAQATFPPPCRVIKTLNKIGGQVVGTHASVCDDGSSAGLGVTLQRRTATGWITVATGDEDAAYTCVSTALREYRVVQTKRQSYFAC